MKTIKVGRRDKNMVLRFFLSKAASGKTMAGKDTSRFTQLDLATFPYRL